MSFPPVISEISNAWLLQKIISPFDSSFQKLLFKKL